MKIGYVYFFTVTAIDSELFNQKVKLSVYWYESANSSEDIIEIKDFK